MSFRCTTYAPIGTLVPLGCQRGYEPPFSNRRSLLPDDRRVPEQSPNGARIRFKSEWRPPVGRQDNFCRLPYRFQAKVVIETTIRHAETGDEFIAIGLAS